ncbi:hypothetical protein GCM10008018_24530 [Paenibacillus marchantiophytorum]|uniref:Uncharacterized protein n=1 Tax=Paenibacillus marchantiophytorum TaxID=1619310 RepID=A0ABQ1EM35_9BACL|nr:hypothetical protein [Paenibacillus marchantiophytorum]GFZ78175.1 hypothetical protein GCM10008018_24530 [Paenibacillus marchantiophytorum]
MRPDRQALIDDFFAMVRKLNRTGSDIMHVREFFWRSSEIRAFIPPTVEFMTVLRTYNAVVFHEFRKSLVPNTSMHILASCHMEAGEALISLGITSLEELQLAVKGRIIAVAQEG